MLGFLWCLIRDALLLLGHLSGGGSFPKPLSRQEEAQALAAMQAGDLRPRESGLTPGAGGAFAESPEHWSRQTREELKTRARRGEMIRL